MSMTTQVPFTKMEGTGNDYVYLDAVRTRIELPNAQEICALSDRRFGIGGDGVVALVPSERAETRMIMWNSDGSRSAMCGNALRCVAMLTAERTGKREFLIESDGRLHEARVLTLNGEHASVEVNVGRPRFAGAEVPFDPTHAHSGGRSEPLLDVRLEVPGFGVVGPGVAVSMGNPHYVLFVEDADRAPVLELGPKLEGHPAFPERTNVEFVSPDDGGSWYQRTFERGSGETLSCGSGACAVLVATVLARGGTRKNVIRLRGGALEMEWLGHDTTGDILMRGPVRRTFTGAFSRADYRRAP